MFLKNTANLFFNPGCALSLYRPENVTEIFKYLQSNYPQIQMHNICCRHNPGLPNGSIIVNVCAGCDRRFRTLYEGISTISLWELGKSLPDIVTVIKLSKIFGVSSDYLLNLEA